MIIQTGADLRNARQRLGLTQVEFADMLGLAPDANYATARKRIRDMEEGRTRIGGPTARLVEAMLQGFMPVPRDGRDG
jgi:transcriptional regulator with XRE-family HTH domain